MRVERGIDDIREVIPFINKVFRKNFPKLLPKIYTSNKYAYYHYIVRENGSIKGALASLPATLEIADRTLNARGIGMVSTDKSMRNKGIMSNMLKAAIYDAANENVDFMFLSGNRQRYEHYGFSPAGYQYSFTIVAANIKHMDSQVKYRFERITANSPYIDEITSLYNTKTVRYSRNNFLDTVMSWNINKVYAILNNDGKVIGHLATLWWKIVDFYTVEQENTAYIVKDFARFRHRSFAKIELYPDMPEAIRSMSNYAQFATVSQSAMINVLNYRNTVENLLIMQTASGKKLNDFNVNIDIEDKESFNIRCINNVISSGDPDPSANTFSIKRNEAVTMLFSPWGRETCPLPFTLPLYVPMCDNV